MRAVNVAPNYDFVAVYRPLYRVDFWEKFEIGCWDLDTWLLYDCPDVNTALEWAHADAAQRSFQLLVSSDPALETSKMVVLCGENPTESHPLPDSVAVFAHKTDDENTGMHEQL